MPLLHKNKIGERAFEGCYSLKHLPSTLNNLKLILDIAFAYCKKLKTLPYMPKMTKSDWNNGVRSVRVAVCLAIHARTDKIDENAFEWCESLPDMPKLKTIDESAFEDCRNLESVRLPKTLKNVGPRAFTNCPLTEIAAQPGAAFNCYCKYLAKKLPNLECIIEGDAPRLAFYQGVIFRMKSHYSPTRYYVHNNIEMTLRSYNRNPFYWSLQI